MRFRGLKCDKPHKGTRLAIGTFTLDNGTSRKRRLDLCEVHASELMRFFLSKTKQPGLEPKLPKPKQLVAAPKRKVGTKYWVEMEDKAMAVMNKLRDRVHINDIKAGADMTTATASNTMRRLVAMHRVVAVGGMGRWRRYNLPES